MKLLRIISGIDPSNGGPIQGIRNITPELLKYDVHTDVLSLDDPESALGKDDSFRSIKLGAGKTSWQYHPGLEDWLVAHLKDYDAVVLHGLWQYLGKALRQAARRVPGAPPIYLMPHGMLDPYFQKAPDRKVKALRNWLYWKLIESKNIRSADALLFTTEEELQLARTSFAPYRPKRELNVSYGITEPPAHTQAQNAAFRKICAIAEEPFFLFLSRIHEKKGVDLLITAYSALKKAHPDMPKLVIAGPGMDSAFGQKLKELSGSSPDIIYPGMLKGDAKWGAFHLATAFILPSHQENFGIAVVEALACGTPVLITDQINIWREIKTEGAGFVEPDTLEGTRNLLQSWIALSAETRDQMRANARLAYQKLYSIENSTKRFLEQIKTTGR